LAAMYCDGCSSHQHPPALLVQLPELCVAAFERLGEMGRQIARLRAIQMRRDGSASLTSRTRSRSNIPSPLLGRQQAVEIGSKRHPISPAGDVRSRVHGGLVRSSTLRGLCSKELGQSDEIVGTMVMVQTLRANAMAVATSVGLYITAAYWFTASTSFANPAVTVARAFSSTFAGIRPQDVLDSCGAAGWSGRSDLHRPLAAG
jgi:hypothetical protein